MLNHDSTPGSGSFWNVNPTSNMERENLLKYILCNSNKKRGTEGEPHTLSTSQTPVLMFELRISWRCFQLACVQHGVGVWTLPSTSVMRRAYIVACCLPTGKCLCKCTCQQRAPEFSVLHVPKCSSVCLLLRFNVIFFLETLMQRIICSGRSESNTEK